MSEAHDKDEYGLSGYASRTLDAFETAVIEYDQAGARPPEDRPAIEHEYHRAKSELVAIICGSERSNV